MARMHETAVLIFPRVFGVGRQCYELTASQRIRHGRGCGKRNEARVREYFARDEGRAG